GPVSCRARPAGSASFNRSAKRPSRRSRRPRNAPRTEAETMIQLGMIGLGRMGGNMVRRLRRGGIDVVGHTRHLEHAEQLAGESGMTAAATVDELVAALAPPRIVWLMLPAGGPTTEHVQGLKAQLSPGDIVVDGANSH